MALRREKATTLVIKKEDSEININVRAMEPGDMIDFYTTFSGETGETEGFNEKTLQDARMLLGHNVIESIGPGSIEVENEAGEWVDLSTLPDWKDILKKDFFDILMAVGQYYEKRIRYPEVEVKTKDFFEKSGQSTSEK